jgi:hypothetical protein
MHRSTSDVGSLADCCVVNLSSEFVMPKRKPKPKRKRFTARFKQKAQAWLSLLGVFTILGLLIWGSSMYDSGTRTVTPVSYGAKQERGW